MYEYKLSLICKKCGATDVNIYCEKIEYGKEIELYCSNCRDVEKFELFDVLDEGENIYDEDLD